MEITLGAMAALEAVFEVGTGLIDVDTHSVDASSLHKPTEKQVDIR